MATKKKSQKSQKVKYESEASYRWGLCMKLAKSVYHSDVTEGNIADLLNAVLSDYKDVAGFWKDKLYIRK